MKKNKKVYTPSPLINDFTKFPRGFEARMKVGTFMTNMFDCTCTNHHCLTTTISIPLLKALDMVSAKFDQPITIVTAYNCQIPAFAKGESLQLQSSANDQLLAIWERLYPEFTYNVDAEFIYIYLKGHP